MAVMGGLVCTLPPLSHSHSLCLFVLFLSVYALYLLFLFCSVASHWGCGWRQTRRPASGVWKWAGEGRWESLSSRSLPLYLTLCPLLSFFLVFLFFFLPLLIALSSSASSLSVLSKSSAEVHLSSSLTPSSAP